MQIKNTIVGLSVIVIILIIAVILLYQQNNDYRSANRTLIIKNDSILSVNLELIEENKMHSMKAHLKKAKRRKD
jgi:CHASE3 domain sensor protein